MVLLQICVGETAGSGVGCHVAGIDDGIRSEGEHGVGVSEPTTSRLSLAAAKVAKWTLLAK